MDQVFVVKIDKFYKNFSEAFANIKKKIMIQNLMNFMNEQSEIATTAQLI